MTGTKKALKNWGGGDFQFALFCISHMNGPILCVCIAVSADRVMEKSDNSIMLNITLTMPSIYRFICP